MIKGIIFDLDGTLLSTDTDLCVAINQMRAYFKLKPLEVEQIKSYLGDGIQMLVTRSLPNSYLSELNKAIELFHSYYAECYNENTLPYTNVSETLLHLQKYSYRLAVVSNKAQNYVDQLINYHFPDVKFDCVYGDSITHKRKPHPQGLLEALSAMNCDKDEVVLVGDSTVDIESANAINIYICPVSWGFQSAELLYEKSSIKPINSIEEIYQFIESLRYN